MRSDDLGRPDLLDELAPPHEASADHRTGGPGVGSMARAAGVTLVLMVLTSLGAIAGGWLASDRLPDVEYASVIWEGLAVVAWCLLWALFAGAVSLALGVVVVALPWARRRGR
ncbi:hypothetical protein KC207_00245 [Phycicoccus sp. BSK3Z-2]|uniref:Uncharacterized protein n=1 Tax=Phycicoccus avicenniae TaxID=2828860 RepID=A0A941HZ03_9MICO|nr:hypothetical protein [Phycicoccus avicenniae]MBR7741724.1 hypothetical protein [Phycicoccus avicenniae]